MIGNYGMWCDGCVIVIAMGVIDVDGRVMVGVRVGACVIDMHVMDER
jgi:hypothetical protein